MENLTRFQQEISLYQELLDCLDAETQALVSGQEELIMAAVGRKELLLDRLLQVQQAHAGGPEPPAPVEEGKRLAALQEQVAVINGRNRELAAASLEVVQEFLAQFRSADAGVYRPGGQAKPVPEATLFQRQA